ncbi:MAG: N-acetyltransferase [Planctomycetota bacterium]|nr:MAG: N-acetyltransferase [Planctomycetota bacterium]
MSDHRIGPETERLLHRASIPEDAEAFFKLNTDIEVMRYTAEPMLESVEASLARIENYPDFETVGYGRWSCVLKSTGEVIGFCGLKYLPDLDVVDVGYRLLREHWGRGYATEASRASIAYGFDEIGLERIAGFVLPENAASIHVLEKCGLQADGEFEEDGLRVLRFVIDRAGYDALR